MVKNAIKIKQGDHIVDFSSEIYCGTSQHDHMDIQIVQRSPAIDINRLRFWKL